MRASTGFVFVLVLCMTAAGFPVVIAVFAIPSIPVSRLAFPLSVPSIPSVPSLCSVNMTALFFRPPRAGAAAAVAPSITFRGHCLFCSCTSFPTLLFLTQELELLGGLCLCFQYALVMFVCALDDRGQESFVRARSIAVSIIIYLENDNLKSIMIEYLQVVGEICFDTTLTITCLTFLCVFQ